MPIFRGGRPPGKKRPSRPGGRPGGGGGKFGKPGGKFGGKPSKKRRPAKKKKKKAVKKAPAPSIDSTGMEGLYFKELVVDETLVVVVLNSGEEILGFVRYYDVDVISVEPADGSPKMLLPKSNIRYVYEAEEALEYDE